MKQFLAGVVVAILVPLLGAFLYFKLGFMPVNADAPPGALEKWIAHMSLDAAVDRGAPRGENPVPDNEQTVTRAAKIFKESCAGCHGSPQGASDFGLAFYPQAPQFFKRSRPFGDPDGNLFYVIKHGIRMTGMPAFGAENRVALLKDEEIWGLVRFLKALPTLPPTAQEELKANPAPAPSPAASGGPLASPSVPPSPSPAASAAPSAGAASPAASASGDVDDDL
jgi:mono/diheme cytochrome c family protein